MAIRTFFNTEPLSSAEINTYCYNNGLKWLDRQSTTSATFLRADVFTTEFDSYRIVIDGWQPTTSENLNLRMRTGAGAYSGANYYWTTQGVFWSSATASSQFGNATTFFQLTSGGSARQHGLTIELNNVRASAKPSLTWMSIDSVNSCNRMGGGFVNNTADYTGVELYTNGSTAMSCVMTIYGYRKS